MKRARKSGFPQNNSSKTGLMTALQPRQSRRQITKNGRRSKAEVALRHSPRRRHSKPERSHPKMNDPFEHHSERDPIEQERNPHGWELFHLDEEGLKVLRGQNEDSGEIYEARITTDFTEDTVKVVIVFKSITTNEVNVWVGVYKWTGKESVDDALFYKEKADSIGLWGLRYNIPIQFTKSA
jgi:hypothetical protein